MAENLQTIRELYESGFASIPKEQGVYFITAPEGWHPAFQSTFFRPAKRPCSPYPAKLLEAKYQIQGCPQLLYIGKAGGRCGLRQRLRQYIRHGYGEVGNHMGGRAIWQSPNCETLLVSWEMCPHPDAREHQLLLQFRQQFGDYPLANWRG